MSNKELQIFCITAEMVERSSTLEESDIGKWCYLNQGCIEGFFDSLDEAEERVKAICSDGKWIL